MQRVKHVLGFLLLAGLWACKKDKSDYTYIQQPAPPPTNASTVRIMNVGLNYTELFLDSTLLTSMTPPNSEGFYLADNTKPTIWFANGRMSATYAIPQQFIRQDGTAHVTLGSLLNGKPNVQPTLAGLDGRRDFDVKEDVYNPLDYYLVLYGPHASNIMLFSDSVFAIHRSISPPANPQNFKIRVLNLSSGPDIANLSGNMTLAFADGTPVNATTTSVAPGVVSDYVEVPYGTYQFKVLTDDGHEMPHTASGGEGINTIDATTGTIAVGVNPVSLGLPYTPQQTFQPGGVYTVLVSTTNDWIYQPPGSNSGTHTSINTYRVVNDITPPQNLSYGRVEAVNALPGASFTAYVDDQPIQETPIAYTAASNYQIYIAGTHELSIKDAAGNVLGKQTFTLNGGDNYSAWVYPDANDKPVLKMIANNLSGSYYSNGDNKGDDGSLDQYTQTMPCNVRFLNLSTDVPEISIMDGNGQPITQYLVPATNATQHLTPGEVVTDQPYAFFSPLVGVSALKVYASSPGIIPGNWIQDIPTLYGTAFIANPALYQGPAPAPKYETGIYTVALVGSLHPANANEQPAKLIVIKHNK
jgi:hypothetical protein